MQDLECKVFSDNNIKLWNRYVDNAFAITKTEQIDELYRTINTTTEDIAFTMETEQNYQIAFLDVLLTRTDNGKIKTQVYRKKTHTDQILNYHSNHPTQHKISCIRTLFNRIETHCNTQESKKKEQEYLHETFRKNNYPRHFIDKFSVQRQHNPPRNTNDEQDNNTTQTRHITLPYIRTISEITSRILEQHRIKVAHKPTSKLRSIFTTHKDTVDNLEKHNAIYMIPCRDCNNVYIGETSKTINSRLTEHKNAIKRQDSRSLPAAHVQNTDHRFHWANTKVLGQANTRYAREFKEAWHSLDKPAINRHIDIPAAYHQLRFKIRNEDRKTYTNTSEHPTNITSQSTIHEPTNHFNSSESTNENSPLSNPPIRCSECLLAQTLMDQTDRNKPRANTSP